MKLRVLVVGRLRAGSAAPPGKQAPSPARCARKYNVACSTCHEACAKPTSCSATTSLSEMLREAGRPNPAPSWPIAFRAWVPGPAEQEGVPVNRREQGKNRNPRLRGAGHPPLPARSGKQISFLVISTLPRAGECLIRDRAGGRRPGDPPSSGSTACWDTVLGGKARPELPPWTSTPSSAAQGYNIYHPQGSTITFEPGENQVGVELYGHTKLSTLRYSFSKMLNENGAIFSKNWVLPGGLGPRLGQGV